MRASSLPLFLLGLLAAPAAAASPSQPEKEPAAPIWNANNPDYSHFHSFSMEANAVMGEMKYQYGDPSAIDTFRDSLDSSVKLVAPQEGLVAFDLYRIGQLAIRRGENSVARHHLDILISRFPDSEWAEKARVLILELPEEKTHEDPEITVPVVTGKRPEFLISRIQSALKANQNDQALAGCQEFIETYPSHPASAADIRLLSGALYLRSGNAAQAVEILRPLANTTPDPALRSKAVYLLGAAYLALGNHEALRRIIGEADTRKTNDKWAVLAQVWRAAADGKEGRQEAALQRYRGVLKAAISSPITAYVLGAIGQDWDRRNRPKEALATISRTAAVAGLWGIEEVESSAKLSSAHLLYKLRRFPAAANAYADFVRFHPAHPQTSLALFQEGLSLKRMGQRERAVAVFSQIAERPIDSNYTSDAHLQLGQLYTELGAGEKAIEHYLSMGAKGKESNAKEAVLLIAQVHYNQKRYRDAIPYYWQFLQDNPLDPRSSEVQELLLNSYWLGDRQNPELFSAVSRYPNHPIVAHIRWQIGVEAYQKGDYERARQFFSSYAADYPKSPYAGDSLFYLGEALSKIGDAQAAAQAYRRFAADYPKHKLAATAGLRLGALLYEGGKYEESAAAYGRLGAGKDETAAEAIFNQAVTLAKAGRKSAALAAYEKLVDRFPKHPRSSLAWFQIGIIREAAGKLAPAISAYSRVASADANKIQSLFNIGRVREKLRQTDQAIKSYEALKTVQPENHQVRLHGLLRLGLLYELKNQTRKAIPVYNEIMRLSPVGSPDYQAADRRMKSIS